MAERATFVASLTSPGKAAVATLAVRGPLAWPATRSVFRPRHGNLPDSPPVGETWLGQLGDDARDDVIVVVKRDATQVWLEIHCHGGPEVVRLIEELYARHGVQVCSWQELERQSSEPAWRVAVQEWLVQAPTARTAAILLDQYHGAFQRAIQDIEDRGQLDRLAQLVPLGRHLVQPWSVVVAGAPNVGKSALVNALAGYTRSIVAPTAGTTRDVVKTILAIDGWPVELSDTAGFRAPKGAIEEEGIARARVAAASADLCLWLLDGSMQPITPESDGVTWRIVINKVDLAPAWDWPRFPDAIRVSAQTKAGLGELCDAISRWLVPHPPSAGEAVPFSPEACDEVLRLQARSGVT